MQEFKYLDGKPAVSSFGLQSYYYELGERSYMKDMLGLMVLREAGVPTPESFYLDVRLNGRFFGLFGFIEDVDNTFLKVGGWLRVQHILTYTTLHVHCWSMALDAVHVDTPP